MRPAPLLLSFLLAAVPAVAAPAARSFEVDDATTAVLVEDHRAPVVWIEIDFPAGTWSPWAVREHVEEAFEIQMHDPAGVLRQRADRLGVSPRLSVGRRSSVVGVSCLKEDLTGTLDLIRDLLAKRNFDRHELSRRREERKISWQAARREPGFAGRQAVSRVLFSPGDPRRRDLEKPARLLGDPARLAAARDVLVRLPGRVIGFAGDLSLKEAEKAAAGLLPPAGGRPAGLDPDLRPVVPANARKKSVTARLPRLTQVYFAFGRDSLPFDDPEYPVFLVADHVLGGHFYSRLLVALRHEGGETYGAATLNLGDTVPGAYGLGTFTRAANAAVAEGKLREVLRLLHENGITEDERQAALGFLNGNRLFRRQSPDEVLERALRERRLGLPPGFLDDAVERASSLTLDEINRFVFRFYDPAQFSMVRVAPAR